MNRIKKLMFAAMLLVAASAVYFGQTGPGCYETIKGRHQGRPVWLAWRATQCVPRLKNPRPGKRQRILIEEYARRNMLDDGTIVQVYPRDEVREKQ